MTTPSRLTNGLATVSSSKPLGFYPLPDPIHTSGSVGKQVFTYANDFSDIGTTTLNTITGGGTYNLVAGVGGIVKLTPVAAAVATVARAFGAFQFVQGNKFWYVTRFQTSAVTAATANRVGLQVGTGANTTNDSIYFSRAVDGAISLVSTVNTTAVTLVSSVLAAGQGTNWIDVGFYYDGTDLIVFANDVEVARVRDIVIQATTGATAITNGVLTPFMQMTPTAANETISQDYVFVAQETTR